MKVEEVDVEMVVGVEVVDEKVEEVEMVIGVEVVDKVIEVKVADLMVEEV